HLNGTCECNPDYTGEECNTYIHCKPLGEPTVKFSVSGTSIELTFVEELDTTISTECSVLFEQYESFGTGSQCQFKTNHVFEILLGLNHMLEVGSEITLKNQGLKAKVDHSQCNPFFPEVTYTIEKPAERDSPVAILTAPTIISECQNLVLDASSSY